MKWNEIPINSSSCMERSKISDLLCSIKMRWNPYISFLYLIYLSQGSHEDSPQTPKVTPLFTHDFIILPKCHKCFLGVQVWAIAMQHEK